MQNMTLGNKIKGIRQLKGIKQDAMAALLDMSVRGYSDIGRGATDVPFSRLEQIAEKLGVKVSDVLDYGDRVSNFFDQCSTPQVVTGVNNGGQTATTNYDTRELQHQVEKLQLELKLCQAEKEKAEMEAKYWREKNQEEQR